MGLKNVAVFCHIAIVLFAINCANSAPSNSKHESAKAVPSNLKIATSEENKGILPSYRAKSASGSHSQHAGVTKDGQTSTTSNNNNNNINNNKINGSRKKRSPLIVEVPVEIESEDDLLALANLLNGADRTDLSQETLNDDPVYDATGEYVIGNDDDNDDDSNDDINDNTNEFAIEPAESESVDDDVMVRQRRSRLLNSMSYSRFYQPSRYSSFYGGGGGYSYGKRYYYKRSGDGGGAGGESDDQSDGNYDSDDHENQMAYLINQLSDK